jgi:hypothetical protein
MRQISSSELSRIRSSQLETLHDECIIQTFSSSGSNTFGETTGSWVSGSTIACALWENGGVKSYAGQIILTEADATLRLPSSASSISSKDRINVISIYGVATGSRIYQVFSNPKIGISGIVVELKRFLT